MNTKAMVPLVLAVVLGLTAALLVRSAMSHRSAAAGPGNLVTVVVAKLDADPGHALTPEDLGTAQRAGRRGPRAGVLRPRPAGRPGDRLPAGPGRDGAGQPAGPGRHRVGAAGVDPGRHAGGHARGVGVQRRGRHARAGLPGRRRQRHAPDDPKKPQSFARTVLQNIKVSAVGRNIAAATRPRASRCPRPATASRSCARPSRPSRSSWRPTPAARGWSCGAPATGPRCRSRARPWPS